MAVIERPPGKWLYRRQDFASDEQGYVERLHAGQFVQARDVRLPQLDPELSCNMG